MSLEDRLYYLNRKQTRRLAAEGFISVASAEKTVKIILPEFPNDNVDIQDVYGNHLGCCSVKMALSL